jgi:hypothetical protein
LQYARVSLEGLAVRSRHAWVAAVAMVLTAATRPSLADALGDLEKGYSAFAARKYKDADVRLRALAQLDASPSDIKDPDIAADARMYLGAVLVAEGKKEEASSVFETLLKDKPDYEPDRLRVPLEAVDTFIDVKSRLRAELEKLQAERVQREQADRARAEAVKQKAAQRLAALEKLAGEERVVEPNLRWKALLPFGVGQFQNGQTDLGWVFLSSESLLALGSAVAAVISLYEVGQWKDAVVLRDNFAAEAYRTNAYNAAVGADALAGGFLLAAIVGAVHAEITFVPERISVRKRTLPALSLSPTGGALSVKF